MQDSKTMSSIDAQYKWRKITNLGTFEDKLSFMTTLSTKFANHKASNALNLNEMATFEQVLHFLQHSRDYHQTYLAILGAIQCKDISVLVHYIRKHFILLPLNVRKLVLRGIAKAHIDPNMLYALMFDDGFRQMNHNTYYRRLFLGYLFAEDCASNFSFFEQAFKSLVKDVGPHSSLAVMLLPHVVGPTVNVESVEEVMSLFKPHLGALQVNSLADWLIVTQQQPNFGQLVKRHPLLLLGLLRNELEQKSSAYHLVWEKSEYRTLFNKIIVNCKPNPVNQLLQLLIEFALFQGQALPSWTSGHFPLLFRKCTESTFKLIEAFYHGDSIKQVRFPWEPEVNFLDACLFQQGYLKTPTPILVRLFDMLFTRGNIPYLMYTFKSSPSTSTRMDEKKEAFWKEIVGKYGMDHLRTHLLQRLSSIEDCNSLPIALSAQVSQRIYSEFEHTLSDVEKMRFLVHFKQIHTSEEDLKELYRKCFHPEPEVRAEMHRLLLEGALAQQVQTSKPITAQIIQWIAEKVKNDRSDVASSIFSIPTTVLFNYINEVKPLFQQCVDVTDEFSDNITAERLLRFVLSALEKCLDKQERWNTATELLYKWIEKKQEKRDLIHSLGFSLRALFHRSTTQLHGKLLQALSSRCEGKWFDTLPLPTVVVLLSPFATHSIIKCSPITNWIVHSLTQYSSSVKLFQVLQNDKNALSEMIKWYLLSSPTSTVQNERLNYLIMLDPSLLSLHVIQSRILYNQHHIMDLFLNNLEDKEPHSLLITRDVLDKISKKEHYIFLENTILWPIFNLKTHTSYLLTSHHALKFTDAQRERFADMLLSYMASTDIHSLDFFRAQLLKTVAHLMYSSNAAVFFRLKQVADHARKSSLKPVKLAASVALANVYQNIPLDASLRSLLTEMEAETANWTGSAFQKIVRFQYLEQLESSVFSLSVKKLFDPQTGITIRKELIRGLRNQLLEFGDQNLILQYFVPQVLKPCWEMTPMHKDMESLLTSVTISILYTLPLDHFLWTNLEQAAASSTYRDTVGHFFSHQNKLPLAQQQSLVKRVHFSLLDKNKNPEILQLAWKNVWTNIDRELSGEIAQRATRAIIGSLEVTPNRLMAIIAPQLLNCIRFAKDEGQKSLLMLVQQLNEHASLDSNTKLDNPVYRCFETIAIEMMRLNGKFPRDIAQPLFETFSHQIISYHPSLALYASQLRLLLGDWGQRKGITTIIETVANKLSEELNTADCFSLSVIANSVGQALNEAIRGSSRFTWGINKQECVLGVEALLNKLPKDSNSTLSKADSVMLSWVCHSTLALGQYFTWRHPVCKSMLYQLRKYPSFVSLLAKHQIME